MDDKEIRRIMRWIAFMYAPIILLIIAVFLLAQYRAQEMDRLHAPPMQSTTSAV